ncbi:tmRNA/ssrA-binding protein [Mesoplasma florum L1]|uniref:SsrA-binding protein n=2 Tax=Mesoplasma florum TaxID=2151 RepID=SSRP_MESFL|nr:SsrA-binding protein SmpB [Mesoplasma florum]Q6F1Q6.1 RecName: Full=SsrA-binding protein; AltName: Full=Small protein B [Mesoplasma florum L1]AAT75567.1 tmRNA/ssrA-binding protein [Mesoplasma florum L1]AGY41283.1 tmRNA-binding protein SmpB [Mesoplasma florum W37]ATI73165.1 SsrA-binding protein [Mesoplasma florum]ATI73852.1 SsrA-binding protein [Mesoplasma florum]AVN59509.1 SsrA-binding protein [Mesoplasma florum]
MGEHVIALNKKAKFNYEILETWEAGIELYGPEIKSIRNHEANIAEAFILIRKKEAFLINANIKKYDYANFVKGIDPLRTRKLLLHKKEINKILKRVMLEKLTIVPLRLYLKGNYAKLEIGLGRGKKIHDKRETIKKRDIERKEMRKYKY